MTEELPLVNPGLFFRKRRGMSVIFDFLNFRGRCIGAEILGAVKRYNACDSQQAHFSQPDLVAVDAALPLRNPATGE